MIDETLVNFVFSYTIITVSHSFFITLGLGMSISLILLKHVPGNVFGVLAGALVGGALRNRQKRDSGILLIVTFLFFNNFLDVSTLVRILLVTSIELLYFSQDSIAEAEKRCIVFGAVSLLIYIISYGTSNSRFAINYTILFCSLGFTIFISVMKKIGITF